MIRDLRGGGARGGESEKPTHLRALLFPSLLSLTFPSLWDHIHVHPRDIHIRPQFPYMYRPLGIMSDFPLLHHLTLQPQNPSPAPPPQFVTVTLTSRLLTAPFSYLLEPLLPPSRKRQHPPSPPPRGATTFRKTPGRATARRCPRGDLLPSSGDAIAGGDLPIVRARPPGGVRGGCEVEERSPVVAAGCI